MSTPRGATIDLQGRFVALSGSVPNRERRPEFYTPGAHVEIAAAVVAITRSVLAAHGRLAMGGHPIISKMLFDILGADYAGSDAIAASGPLILIYQSKAFFEASHDATMTLADLGVAAIRWAEAEANERYDPDAQGSEQCLRSLERMRREMFDETDPLALVCVGGMEGIFREAELFAGLYPDRPIVAFASTGGASRLLPRKLTGPAILRVPDSEYGQPYRPTPYNALIQHELAELVHDRPV